MGRMQVSNLPPLEQLPPPHHLEKGMAHVNLRARHFCEVTGEGGNHGYNLHRRFRMYPPK